MHQTTKGVMELDHRSQDCTVCNTIGMRSKMRTMLKLSFLDTKMMVKFSENTRNKSETMGELNSLFCAKYMSFYRKRMRKIRKQD